MAILITVFQCDNCPEIIGIKTDDDWENFSATWWEGIKFQFCPDCRAKDETCYRRNEDQQLIEDIREKFQSDALAQFV